jgi:hypothetical protein
MPTAKPSLFFYVPGVISGPEYVDGIFGYDQRRISEYGKVVQIPAHGRPLDTQSATAVTLVVALATLERTVEEHEQGLSIIRIEHATAFARQPMLSREAQIT